MSKRRTRPLVVGLLVTALLSIGSLAYATHSFTDVPDDHTFHGDIEWMKDSGITIGCNPPANTQYCPEDDVSRAQIAAFFRRAAESQVFDAGTLDGYDSSAFFKKGDKVGDADTLDGLDSSAFAKKGDSVGNADTLDGLDSTDFVQKGDKASDSDRLDGKDSSAFLGSDVTIREDTQSLLLGFNEVTVGCQAGEIVLAGGFETSSLLTINVTDNHPTGNGWRVAGNVTLLGDLTVYAICVPTG
jgi:hypothetical protein